MLRDLNAHILDPQNTILLKKNPKIQRKKHFPE